MERKDAKIEKSEDDQRKSKLLRWMWPCSLVRILLKLMFDAVNIFKPTLGYGAFYTLARTPDQTSVFICPEVNLI